MSVYWSFVVGLCALAVSAPICAGGTCSQDDVKLAAAKVKAVQAALLAVDVGAGGMETSVPAATRNQIRAFKDALAAAADAFMDCEAGATIDAKAVESRLADLLGANLPKAKTEMPADASGDSQPKAQIYGAELSLAARAEEHDSPLIGLRIGFDVACGEDEMLLMYEWTGSSWRRVVRWQSGDYREISGAFGNYFQYVVFGHRRGNDWLVAVAHGKPWCTSVWSAYDLDVVRPESANSTQDGVFHREIPYRTDSQPALSTEPEGFLLRLSVADLDSSRAARIGLYHYRMDLGQVRRYQPVAENPRDFLDEWLQSDWNEAAAWSAREHIRALQIDHEKVEELRGAKGASGGNLDYGRVQACSGKGGRFQVEFVGMPGGAHYFLIQQGKNAFTMMSASDKADRTCGGADLMGDARPGGEASGAKAHCAISGHL